MDVIMLLTMSLSGTAAFAVYSVLIRLLNERISATSQYICMKFCLLFYLVPFTLGKYLLSRCLPRKLEPLLLDGTIIKLQGNYVQATDGIHFHSGVPEILWAFWLAVILLLLIMQILRIYQYMKKFSFPAPTEEQTALLSTLQKGEGIRRKIRLYHTSQNSSFTYGCLRPAIVINENIKESQAVKMIFLHELQHIKTFDFAFRLAVGAVLFIHCLNPVVYGFFRKFIEIQELACDEKLCHRFSAVEKNAMAFF